MLNKQEEAMTAIEKELGVTFSPHSRFQEYKEIKKEGYVPFSTLSSFMCSTHIHISDGDNEESLVRIYNKLKSTLFDKSMASVIFASERINLFKQSFPESYVPPKVKSLSDFFMYEQGYMRYGCRGTQFLRITLEHDTVELRIFDSTRNKEILFDWVSAVVKLI